MPSHRGGTVVTYIFVAAVVLLFTVILPRTGGFHVPPVQGDSGTTSEGLVTRIISSSSEDGPSGRVTHEEIEVALHGKLITIDRTFVAGGADSFTVTPGSRVLVTAQEGATGVTYYLRDHVRRVPIWALAFFFAVLVILVGGWQGAWSLLGLAASFAVITRFIIPGILSGHNALTISILGSLAIMLTTLLIAHGVNRKTWIAVGGTAISLLLTGLLAALAVRGAQLTGLASEDAVSLSVLTGGVIDARGLLLGGIIIGTLGVLDDITTAQSASVFELRRANPALTARELYWRAMNIGREHIASTTNTLVLAYAGAGLPLLMLLAVQPAHLGILISYETLSTEIVRTLVGSIGLVAAVPITTALAALLVGTGAVAAAPPDPVAPIAR